MSIALAIVVLAAGVWLVWAFNTGVKLRNQQREAWSAVEVQLKKRHDLVPALVECVKGYRAQEEKVFREVAEARTGNEAGLVRAPHDVNLARAA